MEVTRGGRTARRGALLSWFGAVLLLVAASQCVFGDGSLSAITPMPSARMRPNVPTTVWGSVNHGAGTAPTGANYQWTFAAPEGVAVTPEAGQSPTGVVTACRNVSVEISIDLGSHLDAHVTARLTVTQGDTTLSRSTVLAVIGADSPDNATEAMALETDRRIAMRRALRFLYTEQNDDGSWGADTRYGLYGKFGATACVVWAFANAGHTPANQPETDVYQPALLAAVEYIFTYSTTVELTPYNGYDSDTNGNDVSIKLGSDPATAQWEELGYSGYCHAMALAALCACKCPTLRTHTGIFDNGGNGTAFADIIADAADYVLSGAAYGNGGWSYARLSYEPADLSNTSWNIIALEAAESAGVELPGWLWPLCVNFVLSYCMQERWFGYGGMDPGAVTPATHMAGVAALTAAAAAGDSCADRTRKVFVRAVAAIAANWRGVAPLDQSSQHLYCANHGDGYQMWTVARALRMADITTLHAPSGTFDWQRNRTAADADTEGFWPFLVRTQKEDGSWDNPSIMNYHVSLDAAWKTLCLSRGVVGIPDAVRDVRVTCSLPEDADTELARPSVEDTNPAPTVSADAGELTLEWMLGDLTPGTTTDLSYVQVCRNLIAGQRRRVRTSGEILYTSSAAGQARRQTLAPLDVEVVGTQAALSIVADAQSYAVADLALFTVSATLPGAPLFLERVSPGVGVCRFHAPDDHTMHWLRVEWPHADNGGVRIRVRAAPAESALVRVAWSNALTAPGVVPGTLRGAWLELEISVEGEAKPPEIVRVGCAANAASLDVRVCNTEGTNLATVSSIPIGPEDWGTTSTHALNWVAAENVAGACLAVASLQHGGKILCEAQTPFTVTATPVAVALGGVLSVSSTKAVQGQAVQVRSEVKNTDSKHALVNAEVVIRLGGAGQRGQGPPLFLYRVARIDPGATVARGFEWDTGTVEKGVHVLTQTVHADEVDEATATVSVEVVADLLEALELTGWLNAPQTVELGTLFNVGWTLTNSLPDGLGAHVVRVRLLPATSPVTAPPQFSRETARARLAGGATASGSWTNLASAEAPQGKYLLCLELQSATAREEASRTLDIAPVTLQDTIPPITEHDFSGGDTWQTTPPIIQFTAHDTEGASGVEATTVACDGELVQGTNWEASRDGTFSLAYFSTDKAGNVEAEQHLSVNVDTTAPVISHNAPTAAVAAPVTVSFSATDTASGVDRVTYSLDSTDYLAGSAVTLTTGGAHSLAIRAVDLAGNEVVTTVQVTTTVDEETADLVTEDTSPEDGEDDNSGSNGGSNATPYVEHVSSPPQRRELDELEDLDDTVVSREPYVFPQVPGRATRPLWPPKVVLPPPPSRTPPGKRAPRIIARHQVRPKERQEHHTAGSEAPPPKKSSPKRRRPAPVVLARAPVAPPVTLAEPVPPPLTPATEHHATTIAPSSPSRFPWWILLFHPLFFLLFLPSPRIVLKLAGGGRRTLRQPTAADVVQALAELRKAGKRVTEMHVRAPFRNNGLILRSLWRANRSRLCVEKGRILLVSLARGDGKLPVDITSELRSLLPSDATVILQGWGAGAGDHSLAAHLSSALSQCLVRARSRNPFAGWHVFGTVEDEDHA